MMRISRVLASAVLAACLLPCLAMSAEDAGPAPKPLLKKGIKVAVVGDSITEQKLYSKYIECYLVACLADLELQTVQFGWSGERAGGFVARMNNDMMPFKPDLVTTCYGMNDGSYQPYTDAIGNEYRKNMAEICKRIKESGAAMVVGSPGAVDFLFFKRNNLTPAAYNENLNKLGGIARELAVANGFNFANVHKTMIDAMGPAQAQLGAGYHVCGGDGFHPAPNGHLLMAEAFLRGMGIDGQLATIELAGDKATASDGHKVLSSAGGKVELESVRWPFVFFGGEKEPNGTRSILPFTGFNRDLNRFTLKVTGLAAPKAKVTWGTETQSFTKEQLEAGVNLAGHFAETPFSEHWKKLDAAVSAKQSFETQAIKETITKFPALGRAVDNDPEGLKAIEVLRAKILERHAKLAAAVRATVVPVKHTITVTPEP